MGSQKKRLIECEGVKALVIALSSFAIIKLMKRGLVTSLSEADLEFQGFFVLGRFADFISNC